MCDVANVAVLERVRVVNTVFEVKKKDERDYTISQQWSKSKKNIVKKVTNNSTKW